MRARALLLALVLGAACGPEAPHRGSAKGSGSDGRLLIVADGGPSLVPGEEAGTPSPPPPSGPSLPTCGNGRLDPGELCDGTTRSCVELDAKRWASGLARCDASCAGYLSVECVPLAPVTPPPQPPPPAPPPPSIDGAVATISEASLMADLATISADDYGGRFPGSAGDKKLRAFAAAIFSTAGLTPAAPGYLQPLTCGGAQTANLAASLPGNDPALKDEVVIVGAHHDHLGSTSNPGCQSKGGSPICNGADDNGSGTVAVLAIARALAALKGQNRRTLLFLLFAGEEQGLQGSLHYVEKAPLYPLAKTVYMVNLDMIGYANGKVDALGIARSPLAQGWASAAAGKHGITLAPTSSAGGGSDHYHFALAGVPYVFFHTGLSPCFHASCDTVEKIHGKQYAQITAAVARFLWTLAQEDKSPRSDFKTPTSACPAAPAWSSPLLFQTSVDHTLASPCGI